MRIELVQSYGILALPFRLLLLCRSGNDSGAASIIKKNGFNKLFIFIILSSLHQNALLPPARDGHGYQDIFLSFCRYPYIAGFNASQTYRYILNIITFTENLFRSKGPFSCLIESFIITGYRNLYQARFMYSHTITGYATNSEGIHLLHLLHIYSKRDRIIIRPRTPFKVRILQASTYPVSQKFLIRITSRHRFGGCQIPTNRKRQCLSHLSAFHKS